MRTLLIDDMRTIDVDATAKNYDEGIKLLQQEVWDILYLDHDLGMHIDYDAEKLVESKTGYDILLWLNRHLDCMPKRIVLISQNPIGKEHQEMLLKEIRSFQRYLLREQSKN